MKKHTGIILLFCCLMFLSACMAGETDDAAEDYSETYYDYEYDYEYEEELVSEPEETEVFLENLPDPVMINADFNVTVNSEGSFVIGTNLPDGTELSLSLSGRGYLAQGKAFVKDGAAVSERFTNKGSQLEGEYTLEVLMPIPNVQSEYVKHFIGAEGEYLTGPYVKGALGTVVVSKEFEVSFYPESQEAIAVDEIASAENGSFYRTKSGTRYHSSKECAGKNSYASSNIEDLLPCSKCIG